VRAYKIKWQQDHYDMICREGLGWVRNGKPDRSGFGEILKRQFWNGYEGKPRRKGDGSPFKRIAYMAGRDTRALLDNDVIVLAHARNK